MELSFLKTAYSAAHCSLIVTWHSVLDFKRKSVSCIIDNKVFGQAV